MRTARPRSVSRCIQAATWEVECLGDPALRAVPTERPDRELNVRMKRLPAVATLPERLRQLRAVELLVRIGTPHARKVLEILARGPPAARPGEAPFAFSERIAARRSFLI